MQVFVLGMHGSGSSAVGQLIRLMGARDIDSTETIKPISSIDKDYWWSNATFYNINSELMDTLLDGSSSIVNFDVDNIPPSPLSAFNVRAKALMETVPLAQTTVISDPRNCLFLPLWLHYATDPVCLHVINEPLITAETLEATFGCPRSESVALWEFYNKHALACSKDHKRLVITWQSLQANPTQVLEALREKLTQWGATGLQPALQVEVDSIMASFAQPVCTLSNREYLNSAQEDFYHAIWGEKILSWDKYFVSAGGVEMLTRFERTQYLEAMAKEYEVAAISSGLAALNTGQFDLAEQFANLVLQVEAGNPDALHLYGLALSMKGDHESAKKLIKKSVEIRPDAAMPLNDLGMIYHLIGDDEKARECFEKTLQLAPDFELAKNNLASLAA